MVHWSRAEEFQRGFLRPMAVIDVRAGLDAAGSITAWDFLDINAGAEGFAFPYAYAVPNRRLRYRPANSPHAQGPYRALSATANTFARESHIDELAYVSGEDPLRFRLRHLDDDRLAAVLQAAAERFGWRPGWRSAGRPAWRDGHWVWRGTGLAAGLEKGGRVATCAEALTDTTGHVRVTRIVTAYECGAVVNRDTVINQIEGGMVMALGGALSESVAFDHGQLARPSLSGYRVPRFADVPELDVVLRTHMPGCRPAPSSSAAPAGPARRGHTAGPGAAAPAHARPRHRVQIPAPDPGQCRQDRREAGRVGQETHPDPHGGDEHARDRGADRAGDVGQDAIEADRALQPYPPHHLRDESLPRRLIDGVQRAQGHR